MEFSQYLRDNGFSGQYGLPADLTGFDYRYWVLNVQGGQDNTPVRDAFEDFHEQTLLDFYSFLKTEINAYAMTNHGVAIIPFSMNNTSATNQSTDTPYRHPAFEFWLGETSEQFGQVISGGPDNLYSKIKNAESLGRFQMFTGSNDSETIFPTREEFVDINRNIFAATYASGSQMLVPWDKFRRDGGARFSVTEEEFADLTDLVADHRSLFDDHEEVFAVGGDMPPRRASGLEVNIARLVGAPNDALMTVRAVSDNESASIVVHHDEELFRMRQGESGLSFQPSGFGPTSRALINDGFGRFSMRHGFSSNHTGGVYFAFADGSTRFISEEIDPVTYGRLASMKDEAVIGNDF